MLVYLVLIAFCLIGWVVLSAVRPSPVSGLIPFNTKNITSTGATTAGTGCLTFAVKGGATITGSAAGSQTITLPPNKMLKINIGNSNQRGWGAVSISTGGFSMGLIQY